MSEYSKPLPQIQPFTEAFWEGTRNNKLLVQTCNSCDARIFACEYPGMDVITTGIGSLAVAHSDDEQIDAKAMTRCAEFLAHFILKQTGTVV